jgi:hypothetical protein
METWATVGGKTVREAGRVGRQCIEKRKSRVLAGAGCLILLLAGCAPAVMLTRNYIDNRGESGESAQVYPVSSDQLSAEQTPLLTTKNYRDATGKPGQFTRVYPSPLDQVWPAALATLGQFQASVTKSVRGSSGGDIEGLWVGGESLQISLEQTGGSATTVTVLIGQFGDREAEDAIYARIGDNLRTNP